MKKYLLLIKFTELTFAFIVVVILGCSLIYVFGQIPKVKAQRISCAAFKTHYLAQEFYDQQKELKEHNLPYDRIYTRLDGDNDGLACESRV